MHNYFHQYLIQYVDFDLKAVLVTSNSWLSDNTFETLYYIRGMIWVQEFMVKGIHAKTLYL